MYTHDGIGESKSTTEFDMYCLAEITPHNNAR